MGRLKEEEKGGGKGRETFACEVWQSDSGHAEHGCLPSPSSPLFYSLVFSLLVRIYPSKESHLCYA